VGFLSQEFADAYKTVRGDVSALTERFNKECGEDLDCQLLADNRVNEELVKTGKLPHVSWEKIVEHIDHAVKVAGVDHVGLGSDFDGATMPIGMEDATKLPKLTDALLKKGYTEADVEKVLGGNLLRVMEAVERVKGTLP
jgi:microsomal dipeptidase-like Zn-dependent dipeptidase